MKVRTFISLVSSISALAAASSCSINRADSLRMLDKRADYESAEAGAQVPGLREAGIEGFRNSPVPVRSRGLVATVRVYPREIARNIYFWGGWLSLVIEEPQWVLTQPGASPAAPGISPFPGSRGSASKQKGLKKIEPVGVQPAPKETTNQ